MQADPSGISHTKCTNLAYGIPRSHNAFELPYMDGPGCGGDGLSGCGRLILVYRRELDDAQFVTVITSPHFTRCAHQGQISDSLSSCFLDCPAEPLHVASTPRVPYIINPLSFANLSNTSPTARSSSATQRLLHPICSSILVTTS